MEWFSTLETRQIFKNVCVWIWLFFFFFYLSSPFVRPYKRIEDNHKLPIIYLISFASEGDLGDSSSSLAFSPAHLRRRPEWASGCPHSPAMSHLPGLQRLFVWLGCCQTGGQTALVWSWEKLIDPLQGRHWREQPAGPHIQPADGPARLLHIILLSPGCHGDFRPVILWQRSKGNILDDQIMEKKQKKQTIPAEFIISLLARTAAFVPAARKMQPQSCREADKRLLAFTSVMINSQCCSSMTTATWSAAHKAS